MQNFKIISLKAGKEKSLLRMHPWVFSGAIQSKSEEPKNGELVEVISSTKHTLGIGHYQNASISVRIIAFGKQVIDQNFWNTKIQNAWDLRTQLGLTQSSSTNAFRLVHGEGDGLPGLIIDYYNGAIVIQCHSLGMYLNRIEIVTALQSLSIPIVCIYDKSAETLSKEKSFEIKNEYLFGTPTPEMEILENNLRFLVNWESGQKTGFFLDQRDNRKLLQNYSENKKVLNTFCYSGGFSIYALAAGAKEVHSLDSSAKAIDLTEKNIALNNFGDRHTSITQQALNYLANMPEDFDVVVLDPPAFAKHLSAKHNAIQGYRRLNELAISKMKKDSILFTFSCSQAIDMNTFTGAIFSAASNCNKTIRILHRLHQPADHPISLYHPEGEYLKGLVLSIS